MSEAALLERIAAECNNTRLGAGELAENILEIIQASKARQGCADCIGLRARLVNIYHLTLTYRGDAAETLRAVRAASGPGAPAPASSCRCDQAELVSKLDSQGRMLEECANTLAIAGYGDLAWRGHAMRKATRAVCATSSAPDRCEAAEDA